MFNEQSILLDHHPSFIDLTANSITKKRVKLAEMESLFKDIAIKNNSVLIGHIGLVQIGRGKASHVIAFCATSNNIYYIDGQFYDGINHLGDPIFQDLSTKFAFTTQYDALPQGNVADDCFYLIHRLIPYSVVMERAVKKEKENEPEMSENVQVSHKRKLDEVVKEKEKKDKNTAKKIRQEEPEQGQSNLINQLFFQNNFGKIAEKVARNSEKQEVLSKEQVEIKIPTFEEINSSIHYMNRLARTKNGECTTIDECRRIISVINKLKENISDDGLKKKLEVREYHCYYQIMQCQKRAGFLSLAMPQVKEELSWLSNQLKAIINACQVGIPCRNRDTYTISMSNNTKNAILSLQESQSSLAQSSLQYATTLITYISTNKIEELKTYFKPSRGTAIVSDYIEEALKLLDEANNYFVEKNNLDKVNECNELIRELEILLNQFLPEQYTFFGDRKKIETVTPIESYDKGKEKVF